MSEPFDPYLQWLGIRDPQRPPSHYRLLGIELFESDPLVITNAADRQMTHVRAFQAGPRSEESQRVLNEIAAAKVCLLNSGKKEAYDGKLRAEILQGGAVPAPPAAKTPAPPPAAPPAAPPVAPPFANGPETRRIPAFLLIGGLGIAAAVLLGLIVFMVIGGGNDSDKSLASGERGETEAAEGIGEKPVPATPGRPEPTTPKRVPEPVVSTPAKSGPGPGPSPKPETGKTGKEAKTEEPPAPKPPVKPETETKTKAKPETPKPEPKQEPGPGKEKEPEPGKISSTAKPGGESSGAKSPIPDKAAQAAARKEIGRVYKDDYAAAQKPADKAALAEKLMSEGVETKDNPVYRYVLFAEARDLALLAGDTALLHKAANAIGKSFEVEPLEELARALAEAAERSSMPTLIRKAMARAALEYAEEAAKQDAFDLSVRLATVGHTLALKARDGITARQATEYGDSIPWLKEQYATAQLAIKALEKDPDNAKANLALGCYYAMIKSDWEKGLPLLAKGNSAKLKAMAEAELAAGTPSSAEMVKLGEQWAAVVSTLDESYRPAVRRHALSWFDKALPELKGFTQTRVNRLMQELKDQGGGRRRP